MKKEEVKFDRSFGAMSYGDIVEVVSEEFGYYHSKRFLIIQSGHGEAILIELDKDSAEWNRYSAPVAVNWSDLSTENFAEIFGFPYNVKVQILTRKTTLVYESDEINVEDVIRWNENSNVSGVVRYKTKSKPTLYYIDEYQGGRTGLTENEIEKVFF